MVWKKTRVNKVEVINGDSVIFSRFCDLFCRKQRFSIFVVVQLFRLIRPVSKEIGFLDIYRETMVYPIYRSHKRSNRKVRLIVHNRRLVCFR